MSENARPLNEGSDEAWLRALAQWIADVAESPTESARALVIADRLESLQSRCRALEALVREAKWRCWQPGANGQPTISDWLTRVDAALAVPPTGEPMPLPDLPAKGDE